MLRDGLDHYRARGLLRPLPCSGTAPTTIVLGDYSDHYRARGLLRPLPCSGTAQTTAVLGHCPDHCHAWGLLRLLMCSGTVPTTARRSFFSATCDLYSHTVERHLFRPCYKAHISPFSKLGDYVGTMHLPVHLVSPVQRLDFLLRWKFFFRPWHHMPVSPTTRLGD